MQDLYKVSDWLSGLAHEPRKEDRMPALSSLTLRREVAVERNDIQCKSLDTVLFLCYDYISCTGHYIALSPHKGWLATMNWEKTTDMLCYLAHDLDPEEILMLITKKGSKPFQAFQWRYPYYLFGQSSRELGLPWPAGK